MLILKQLILLYLVLIVPIYAQDIPNIPIEKAPQWVLKKQVEIPTHIPIKDINNGIYYIDVDNQIKVDKDEKTAFYSRYAELIVNQEGLEEVSQINLRYDPTYQSILLHSLIIYRNGQQIDKTKTAKIKLLQRESGLEEQLYDGQLTLNILIDDLRVGDVIEHSYTRIGSNPVYKGIFNYNRSVEWSIPVHYQYLRVLWGKPEKLHIKKLHTDIPVHEKNFGNYKEYSLVIKENTPYHFNSQTPKWFQPYGTVYLYESEDWNDIAVWASSLYENVLNGNGKTREIAKQINDMVHTPKEKISAALDYVQSNIRYLGIEMGTNSHMPSIAKETIQRRYGDCKDKAVVFISILKALGIEAYPALVNTEIKNHIANLPPLVDAFDHVIVKVILDDKVYWLDPTREYQTGSLANTYQPDYGYALVVKKETTQLESMNNPTQVYKKVILDHFDLSQGAEHNVTFESHTKYLGYSAEKQRYDLTTNGITKLQNRYLNFYSAYYSDIEALMTFESEEDPITGDIIQKEKYLIKNFWSVNNEDKEYTGAFYANTITPYFTQPEELQRNSPYLLTQPVDIEHTIQAQLGGKWNITDDKVFIDNSYFSLEFTTTFEKPANLLTLAYHYRSKTDHVPADKIDDYMTERNKAMKLLEYGIVQYFNEPETTPENSTSDSEDITAIIILLVALLYIAAFLYIFISWRLDAKKEPEFPEALFYPTSLTKLIILSIITFNIYICYWFYRNYLYQKQRDNSSIMPIARGFFYNFWYYPLYVTLVEDSQKRFNENRVLIKPLAVLFAVLFFMSAVLSNTDGIRSIIALIITPLFLIPVVNYINYINTTRSEAYIYHSRWRLRHTFLALISVPLIMLVSAEELSLIPSDTVVKGEKIMQHDVQYMHRKGIFPANEKLLYFYSDAFLMIRNDGNGFTQNHVFSYWKEENKLYIEKAHFNTIQKIDVNYSKGEFENTIVTITRKDNSSFSLYVSSIDALDKVFVKQLQNRWNKVKTEASK